MARITRSKSKKLTSKETSTSVEPSKSTKSKGKRPALRDIANEESKSNQSKSKLNQSNQSKSTQSNQSKSNQSTAVKKGGKKRKARSSSLAIINRTDERDSDEEFFHCRDVRSRFSLESSSSIDDTFTEARDWRTAGAIDY